MQLSSSDSPPSLCSFLATVTSSTVSSSGKSLKRNMDVDKIIEPHQTDTDEGDQQTSSPNEPNKCVPLKTINVVNHNSELDHDQNDEQPPIKPETVNDDEVVINKSQYNDDNDGLDIPDADQNDRHSSCPTPPVEQPVDLTKMSSTSNSVSSETNKRHLEEKTEILDIKNEDKDKDEETQNGHQTTPHETPTNFRNNEQTVIKMNENNNRKDMMITGMDLSLSASKNPPTISNRAPSFQNEQSNLFIPPAHSRIKKVLKDYQVAATLSLNGPDWFLPSTFNELPTTWPTTRSSTPAFNTVGDGNRKDASDGQVLELTKCSSTTSSVIVDNNKTTDNTNTDTVATSDSTLVDLRTMSSASSSSSTSCSTSNNHNTSETKPGTEAASARPVITSKIVPSGSNKHHGIAAITSSNGAHAQSQQTIQTHTQPQTPPGVSSAHHTQSHQYHQHQTTSNNNLYSSSANKHGGSSSLSSRLLKDYFIDPLLGPPPFPIQQPPLLTPPDQSPRKSERSQTLVEGELIACFTVGGEKRLCVPQIFHIVLRNFSLHQINQVIEELQINCSTCTRDQMEVLKLHGDIPSTTPSCGLITKTDAHRLCSTLLMMNQQQQPPSLDFPMAQNSYILIYHECFGRCIGRYSPFLYKQSSSPCIECDECHHLFTPYNFVCHSHRQSRENRTVHWGFDPNNWRSYILPIEDLATYDEKISKNLHNLYNLMSTDPKNLENNQLLSIIIMNSIKQPLQHQQSTPELNSKRIKLLPCCHGGRKSLKSIERTQQSTVDIVFHKNFENTRNILKDMKQRFNSSSSSKASSSITNNIKRKSMSSMDPHAHHNSHHYNHSSSVTQSKLETRSSSDMSDVSRALDSHSPSLKRHKIESTTPDLSSRYPPPPPINGSVGTTVGSNSSLMSQLVYPFLQSYLTSGIVPGGSGRKTLSSPPPPSLPSATNNSSYLSALLGASSNPAESLSKSATLAASSSTSVTSHAEMKMSKELASMFANSISGAAPNSKPDASGLYPPPSSWNNTAEAHQRSHHLNVQPSTFKTLSVDRLLNNNSSTSCNIHSPPHPKATIKSEYSNQYLNHLLELAAVQQSQASSSPVSSQPKKNENGSDWLVNSMLERNSREDNMATGNTSPSSVIEGKLFGAMHMLQHFRHHCLENGMVPPNIIDSISFNKQRSFDSSEHGKQEVESRLHMLGQIIKDPSYEALKRNLSKMEYLLDDMLLHLMNNNHIKASNGLIIMERFKKLFFTDILYLIDVLFDECSPKNLPPQNNSPFKMGKSMDPEMEREKHMDSLNDSISNGKRNLHQHTSLDEQYTANKKIVRMKNEPDEDQDDVQFIQDKEEVVKSKQQSIHTTRPLSSSSSSSSISSTPSPPSLNSVAGGNGSNKTSTYPTATGVHHHHHHHHHNAHQTISNAISSLAASS